jgi:hypothetical protein
MTMMMRTSGTSWRKSMTLMIGTTGKEETAEGIGIESDYRKKNIFHSTCLARSDHKIRSDNDL